MTSAAAYCPGTGKRQYPTLGDADEAVTQHAAAGVTRTYLCHTCGTWHLTSRPQRGYNADMRRDTSRPRRRTA